MVPTTKEISEIHFTIRQALNEKCNQSSDFVRLLYGGSVKPSNVHQIIDIDNVDGCLVGGASLQGDTFSDICLAYSNNELK